MPHAQLLPSPVRPHGPLHIHLGSGRPERPRPRQGTAKRRPLPGEPPAQRGGQPLPGPSGHRRCWQGRLGAAATVPTALRLQRQRGRQRAAQEPGPGPDGSGGGPAAGGDAGRRLRALLRRVQERDGGRPLRPGGAYDRRGADRVREGHVFQNLLTLSSRGSCILEPTDTEFERDMYFLTGSSRGTCISKPTDSEFERDVYFRTY